MAVEDRLAAVREHAHKHRYRCWSDMTEFLHLLELLELELGLCSRRPIPASAKIAAFLKGVLIMSDQTLPSGATIELAGVVKNAPTPANPDGAVITNDVQWSSDQGTLTADPGNPESATLVNVPDGDVTVTMTTTNGIVAQHTYTLADLTPASADFTATAA